MSIIMNLVYSFFLFYSTYSVFIVIKTFIIASDNGYDELEKKALIDALAVSMLILMALHIIQIISSIKFKQDFPGELYIPLVSSGAPYSYPGAPRDTPMQIESIKFDTFIIAITYNINRFRYALINAKQFFKPFLIIAVLLFVLFIIVLISLL